MNIVESHQISPDAPALAAALQNPGLVGLEEQDLAGMSADQRRDLIVGEYFAQVSRAAGVLASRHLMRGRWGYTTPEWYDHRNHLLDPETHFTDFWTMLADIGIEKMPMGAKVLDLCSGDGFYAYWFYRHRASEVTCVELDASTHRQAMRLHGAPNIRHVNASVLEFDMPESHYDTILIRGAIEHFSEEAQQELFKKARRALKPGGWFCGDTPANPEKGQKMLDSHEFEWADEAEMRSVLTKVFPETTTSVLVSKARTTLLWQCKK